MRITKTADKMTAASYSGTCTIVELDNFTGIRKASLALLDQMGVDLTGRSKTELSGAATQQSVNAQTALAQGITSQQKGTVVEALSYYIQSANVDPGLAEAASRLNVLSANITSGNIGENVRNDLQWRDQWIARLKECEEWYLNYIKNPPPCYLVYSTDIKQGDVDYQKRSVSLSFGVQVNPEEQWYNTADVVLRTVRQGLLATGRAKTWGLEGWLNDTAVSTQDPFGNLIYGVTAEFEIINEEGKSIGKTKKGFPYGGIYDAYDYLYGNKKNLIFPICTSNTSIIFPAVDPNQITNSLVIRISSIDGQPTEATAQKNNIAILTTSEYFKARPRLERSRPYHNRGGGVVDYLKYRDYYWIRETQEAHRIVVIPYGEVSIEGFNGEYGEHTQSIVIPDSVKSFSFNASLLMRSMSIGANVRVFISGSRDDYGYWFDAFSLYYNQNGKKAGIYYCTGIIGEKWYYRIR
jgi:hypothetical protein